MSGNVLLVLQLTIFAAGVTDGRPVRIRDRLQLVVLRNRGVEKIGGRLVIAERLTDFLDEPLYRGEPVIRLRQRALRLCRIPFKGGLAPAPC